MAFIFQPTPANVEISLTDTDGEHRRSIFLMEGESAFIMGRKLIALEDNNLIVRSVKYTHGNTREEYVNEWKKLVSEDKTTDSLEDWYYDAYR